MLLHPVKKRVFTGGGSIEPQMKKSTVSFYYANKDSASNTPNFAPPAGADGIGLCRRTCLSRKTSLNRRTGERVLVGERD